jgi:hypothetical protein
MGMDADDRGRSVPGCDTDRRDGANPGDDPAPSGKFDGIRARRSTL